MKKLLFVLIVVVLLPVALFSQDTWDRIIHPFDDNYFNFRIYEIIKCNDNGYAIRGYCDYAASEEVFEIRTYITKINSTGYIEWTQQDSLSGYSEYNLYDQVGFTQTNDGGFIVAAKYSLFKYDQDGNREWEDTNIENNPFVYSSIESDQDGNVYVTGSVNGIPVIKVIDEDNNIIWEESYAWDDITMGNAIKLKPYISDGFLCIFSVDYQTEGLYGLRIVYFNSEREIVWSYDTIDNPEFHGFCQSITYSLFDDYFYINNANSVLILDSQGVYINSFSYLPRSMHELKAYTDDTFISRVSGGYEVYDRTTFEITYSSQNETGLDLGNIYGFKSFEILEDGYMITCGTTWEGNIHIFKTNSLGAVPIEEDTSTPQCQLKLNSYPNPFNPQSTIEYYVPKRGLVDVSVYNVKGQKVRILMNKLHNQGTYSIVWDGKDSNNKPVSSGIYFYNVKTEDQIQTKKCILMK